MLLYPKIYLEKVTDLSKETVFENKIKGIILDVDNTLLDFDKNLLPNADAWCEELKKDGIKLIIVSNSNKEEKVKSVAEKLDIPYVFFAIKPFKKGFKKAKQILELEADEIAVIGDQIFTDVLGANRMKMFPILVKPLAEKDYFITIIKRPLENLIIKKYMKSITKEKEK